MTNTVPGWLHFVRAPTPCEWCAGSGYLKLWGQPYSGWCPACKGTGRFKSPTKGK